MRRKVANKTNLGRGHDRRLDSGFGPDRQAAAGRRDLGCCVCFETQEVGSPVDHGGALWSGLDVVLRANDIVTTNVSPGSDNRALCRSRHCSCRDGTVEAISVGSWSLDLKMDSTHTVEVTPVIL